MNFDMDCQLFSKSVEDKSCYFMQEVG